MWSHYADNNRGICVEYDFSKIESNSPIWNYFFPVVYVNERQKVIDLREISNDNIERSTWIRDTRGVFSQKDYLWKYEKEWRLVITETDISEITDYIEKHQKKHLVIDFPYVSRVFLGPGLLDKQNDVIELIEKTRVSRIPLMFIKWKCWMVNPIDLKSAF